MTLIRLRPRTSTEPISTEPVAKGSQIRPGEQARRSESAVVPRPAAEPAQAPAREEDELTPPGGYLIEELAASLRTPEAPASSEASGAQGWVDEDTGRYTDGQRAALRAAHSDAAPPEQPLPPARAPRAKLAPRAKAAALPPPPKSAAPAAGLALRGKVAPPSPPVGPARPAAPPPAGTASRTAAPPPASTASRTGAVPHAPPLLVSLTPTRAHGDGRARPLLIGALLLVVLGVGAYAMGEESGPVEPTAALVVHSTPPGAKVVLAGRALGDTPLEMDGLAIGPALLELHLSGHGKVQQQLHLLADERNVINAFLTPAPPTPAPAALAEEPVAASQSSVTAGSKDARAAPTARRVGKAARRRGLRSRSAEPSPVQPPQSAESPIPEDSASRAVTAVAAATSTAQPQEPTPPTAAPIATPRPAARPASPRKPQRQRAPVYPSVAKRKGTEGWVRVSFRVDAAGSVLDAAVDDADPPQVFDRAALNAVRAWRYEPLERASGPSPRQAVKLKFRLDH